MKAAVLLSVLTLSTALATGCSTNEPITEEKMVISPTTLRFTAADTAKSVSITHTCSCPFTWSSSVSPAAPWLSFPGSMSGDHAAVAMSVDRSKLTSDSASTTVLIKSNSYGDDSIRVTVIK